MVDQTASELANTLSDQLLEGTDFNISIPDFSNIDFKVPELDKAGIGAPVKPLGTADLTTGSVNGTGVFDQLMVANKAHLRAEYEAGRITGAEYTQAYIALIQGAMSNATQFLLGRDAAYWQAVTAQIAAETAQVAMVIARVELETKKVELRTVQLNALNLKVTYAVNKIRLATESVGYDTAKYTLSYILPEQKNLAAEQVETARAQTLSTRRDGTAVAGTVGKQMALYGQQITSYQRDSENKALKVFTDAWTVMKTIDEGLAPPTGFANTNLDKMLTKVQANNGLT